MKLLYTTSFEKTSGLANRFQVMAMSKAFKNSLGKDFFFGASDFEDPKGQIKVINFGTSKSFFLSFKILKFVKKEKIDYIFCREPRLLFFIHILNSLFFHLKVKTIYEIHELASKNIRQKFFEKKLAKMVDFNILLTGHMAEEFKKKYKVLDNKITVLSDAVDLEIFDVNVSKDEMRIKYNLPQDKKIIGFFGRFKTMGMDKGISDILESMKNLPNDIVFLAMGGKRRDREEYEEKAEEIEVKDRVIFVEQFEQNILAEYQKAVDILLMPFPYTNHFAFYMSPLKMFEYMASKRPIIATDLPSVREILDKETAVLVPPGDPEKLGEVIIDLLLNPEKGQKLANNAYEKVKNYTWEKRVERILKFLY